MSIVSAEGQSASNIDFAVLFPPSRVKIDSEAKSRKAVLRATARLLVANEFTLDRIKVVRALLDRELQGSTALDDSGAAIPHCRLAECQQPLGSFILLKHKAPFGDSEVDLICGVIVPTEAHQSHLDILSSMAKVFSDESAIAELRRCETDAALHAMLQASVRAKSD